MARHEPSADSNPAAKDPVATAAAAAMAAAWMAMPSFHCTSSFIATTTAPFTASLMVLALCWAGRRLSAAPHALSKAFNCPPIPEQMGRFEQQPPAAWHAPTLAIASGLGFAAVVCGSWAGAFGAGRSVILWEGCSLPVRKGNALLEHAPEWSTEDLGNSKMMTGDRNCTTSVPSYPKSECVCAFMPGCSSAGGLLGDKYFF